MQFHGSPFFMSLLRCYAELGKARPVTIAVTTTRITDFDATQRGQHIALFVSRDLFFFIFIFFILRRMGKNKPLLLTCRLAHQLFRGGYVPRVEIVIGPTFCFSRLDKNKFFPSTIRDSPHSLDYRLDYTSYGSEYFSFIDEIGVHMGGQAFNSAASRNASSCVSCEAHRTGRPELAHALFSRCVQGSK